MTDHTLDRPILSLSDKDELRLRDLVEGTLITGAPGSGKSSTSGKQLAFGLLRTPGMGGLVLTAKAEETLNWIAYAKACGRERDLIVFNAESGGSFDPTRRHRVDAGTDRLGVGLAGVGRDILNTRAQQPVRRAPVLDDVIRDAEDQVGRDRKTNSDAAGL